MSYYYKQLNGGNEEWKPFPSSMLSDFKDHMFVTILAVDVPPADDFTKEQFAELKYKGPLYFDLDDSESPASTACYMVELIDKLVAKGVSIKALSLYASGGKGFHLTVPEKYYLAKPPAKGMAFLPAIYKEIAFEMAVESMDMRVYTARRGRMFRQENVKRPNDRYKVRITYEELVKIADLSKQNKAAAETLYGEICSAPREAITISEQVTLAPEMIAMFDQAKNKVTKMANKVKKKVAVRLPEELPSFEALLRGEGIKQDAGFHPIAMQVAITAHARGIRKEDLLNMAEGLCAKHESDGDRYNTAAKRQSELARMWDYTEDNPCYAYSALAITSLLSHQAPDLMGLNVSAEEVQEGIATAADISEFQNPEDGEFDHAGIVLTRSGAYVTTETGQKKVTAMAFENPTELVSATSNTVSELDVDIVIQGVHKGRKVLDLDTFNSVAGINKMMMPFGQAFNGNDQQVRGMFMRVVEKARKSGRRMFVVNREGLDMISMPFHENEEARKDFLIWSDVKSVSPEPRIQDLNIQMKFVGFPTAEGQFKTDLSQAPNLSQWIKEDDNKELLRKTLNGLLRCQKPDYMGKLIGWIVACHYRMMFHKVYSKFPLLHINGAAGSGKCFAAGTPVLMFDGSIRAVETIVPGELLMGPDGTPRKVLTLGRGREAMYRVKQIYGDDYVVNESHILALKASDGRKRNLNSGRAVQKGDTVNITVKDYLQENATTHRNLKGYKSEGVQFTEQAQTLPAYLLGSWLGDGTSARAMLCKPKHTKMYAWWKDYCETNSYEYTEGDSGSCSTLYVKGTEVYGELKALNVINNKHLPAAYKYGSIAQRQQLLAGLIDSDGTVNNAGYRFDSSREDLANDVVFVARSLGIKSTCTKEVYSNKFATDAVIYHVYMTGNVAQIPTLDKKAAERKATVNPLVTGIEVTAEGEGDYYGFEIDGDKLFLLGDFTVVHNTEMTKLMSNYHYYLQEPKMLTPTSTLFAVQYAASGSASIPLILDEFKPAEMNPQVYDKFKLMLRDAYNCRNIERGGGNRESSDYRAVHTTQLSAPLCFIAEAAESESALMERVVLLTLVKPPVIEAQRYLHNFLIAQSNKEVLGIVGSYMAASIVRKYSLEDLESEFNVIYDDARRELMLQESDLGTADQDTIRRKSAAKERVVFNYSVARFGLRKFSNLVKSLFPDEFDTVLEAMDANIFTTVADLQQQTIPEWLKVLNCFADMARVDPLTPYHLKEGFDYAYPMYNDKPCIELYARSCYNKYRVYCGSTRTTPLFPNESAFLYALKNLPAMEAHGITEKLDSPGGSHILGLDELRGAGFIEPRKPTK